MEHVTSRRLEHCVIPAGRRIEGVNFRWSSFSRFVAKNVTFVDCNFAHCLFDRCYLRGATFERCDFSGAQFCLSNLMGVTVVDCTFDYVTFDRTELPVEVFGDSMPANPGARRLLARSLRANATSMGDAAAARRLFLVEMGATRTHLAGAARGKEEYYASRYPGRSNRFKYSLKFLAHVIDGVWWGHGESPLRLALSSAVAICLLAIPLAFRIEGLAVPDPPIDIGGVYFRSLWLTSLAFVGYSPGLASGAVLRVWLLSSAALGYVTLGLFVAAVYRRLSRR
jgi:hypothetical protein